MGATPNGVAVGDVVLLLGSREEWTRTRTVLSFLSGLADGRFLNLAMYRPVLRASRHGELLAERTFRSMKEARLVRAAIASAAPYPPDTDWQAVFDYMAQPD